MTLVCRHCSRVNPPEAHYCYWDGVALDGRGRAGGPIAVGAQPFLSPFVFPSGRQCRNLDELVLACYDEWQQALDLLSQGYLEGFFGSLGRADLALAAKQAAKSADLDRGLDQLLNKLPCSTRQPPKLSAQPLEINLGQISRDGDRSFGLHIKNQGMGLLQGTVVRDDTAWLTLGEGKGSPRKVFQCLHEFTLPVQIQGKALRAHHKTIEARLNIESNGGTSVVVVRADVPVRPFPDGALAGAVSPRQIAEKCKANPKAAAPFFEKGAVAAWYESNGWIYPVQGPASSGLGAIQQFFEALGLVKPPVVEISETTIQLHGTPGGGVEHVLQVTAQEKRPVFAYATTAAPWLLIGRVRLEGRTARIPLKVPNVPNQPGETLRGKVQVTANGGQRFLVEVSLSVAGQTAVPLSPPPPAAVFDFRAAPTAMPVLTTADVVSDSETIPEVPPLTVAQEKWSSRDRKGAFEDTAEGTAPLRSRLYIKHLIPLAVIAVLLFCVVAHDLWVVTFGQSAGVRGGETALVDPEPYIAIRFNDEAKEEKGKVHPPTMRFGLVMLRAKDPADPKRLKKLTFDEWGRTNNTVVRVDGKDYLFGQPNPRRRGPGDVAFPFDDKAPPGKWIDMKSELQGHRAGRPRDGFASSWWLPGCQLQITQEVEIVPGQQSRRLDTCLVRYILDNKDTRAHQVGVRFMLDTFIGANDGVPFLIPGQTGLSDTMKKFDRPTEVPDFIQALEKEDPINRGTEAYLQFHIGENIESPEKVALGGWPNSEFLQFSDIDKKYKTTLSQLTGWDVPFLSMKELDRLARRIGKRAAYDSCVTMYWPQKELPNGKSRVVGFTYGLGDVNANESEGHLLLTVGGRLVRNGEFTLTALVHKPQKDEKLTLHLPPGFAVVEGKMEQTVPPVPAGATRPDSPVTWRLRAGGDGKYELSVQSSKGAKQKLPLTIRTRGVFD